MTPPPLEPGCYYHIYNRGNNGEDLFREQRNYAYFFKLYAHLVSPVADTFVYCLMRNHFHLLIRIKDDVPDKARLRQRLSRLAALVLSHSHRSRSYTAAARLGAELV
jgi:REP element-mobilizing transposase RayT